MLQVEVVDETADFLFYVEVGIECSWIEQPTRRKILKQLVDKFKKKLQRARNFRRKSFGRNITNVKESL